MTSLLVSYVRQQWIGIPLFARGCSIKLVRCQREMNTKSASFPLEHEKFVSSGRTTTHVHKCILGHCLFLIILSI